MVVRGVLCLCVVKGVIWALLGALIVAVVGTSVLITSALLIAAPPRLTPNPITLGFVCAGRSLDPIEPLLP